MACSFFPRAKALFSSPSSQGGNAELGRRIGEDEKAGLWEEERGSGNEEGDEDGNEEPPFPSLAFINSASKYILSPDTQHVPVSSQSFFSSSPQSSPFNQCQSQNQTKGINLTRLAHAFATLAVDAGIYGSKESYVELLAFQLKRMVRGLGAQCWEQGRHGGCLSLQVTRPELNVLVDITIQTRRRRTMHRHLSFLSREREDQIVILALKPLVAPITTSSSQSQDCEFTVKDKDEREDSEDEVERVVSTWWSRDVRFGSCVGEGGWRWTWKWNLSRSSDALWDLREQHSKLQDLENGYESRSMYNRERSFTSHGKKSGLEITWGKEGLAAWKEG